MKGRLKLENYPFRDESLPFAERVEDLIGRLTIDEKLQFFVTSQEAIERLDIPAFTVGAEGAHGYMHRHKPCTTFPQTIGLASSWDRRLLYEIGCVIGKEARAFHMDEGRSGNVAMWFPTIDLERNPLWGRNEEGYGEDPYLTGELASEIVKGAQGDDEKYLQVSCGPKHFIANNNEIDRHSCTCSVGARDLHEYYLRPFKKVMKDAKAGSVMSSYNKLNGIPMFVHPLLQSFIKEECGLEERGGYCVSDCMSFFDMTQTHDYLDTDEESFAMLLASGADVINEPNHDKTIDALRSAVEKGIISEELMDKHLRLILTSRFKYGLFDKPESCPFNRYTLNDILTPESIALAHRAVVQSAVLLKNDNDALPIIPEKTNKIAVFGQLANEILADWYTSVMPYTKTPLDGLRECYGTEKINFVDCRDIVTFETPDGRPLVVKGENRVLTIGEAGEAPARFLREDWGYGVNTLKEESTGLMIESGYDWPPDFRFDEERRAQLNQLVEEFPIRVTGQSSLRWMPSTQFNIIDTGTGSVYLRGWNNYYLTTAGEGEHIKVCAPYTVGDTEKFIMRTDSSWREVAAKAAKESDAVLVFGGNHPMFSAREETDRTSIELPQSIADLVALAADNNARTIFCPITSYPYAIRESASRSAAVITLPHGMQEMGTGLADIICGAVSPSAKLPMTWYDGDEQVCDIMDYDIIGSNQTYKYFDKKPLYPFGYGLSYSSFEYSDLSLSDNEISERKDIEVSFTVKNIGSCKAAEVAQLYTKISGSRVRRPIKSLCGFERIELAPGESARITLPLQSNELKIWDVTSEAFVLENGQCEIMVGASSDDIRLTASIDVIGKTIPPRSFSKNVYAYNCDTTKNVYFGEKIGDAMSAVFAKPDAEIVFEKVDAQSLTKRMRAVICAPRAGCKMEVFCDNRQIADVALPNTGTIAFHKRYLKSRTGRVEPAAWVEVSFDIPPVDGICDLSLKLSDGCGIFSLSAC